MRAAGSDSCRRAPRAPQQADPRKPRARAVSEAALGRQLLPCGHPRHETPGAAAAGPASRQHPHPCASRSRPRRARLPNWPGCGAGARPGLPVRRPRAVFSGTCRRGRVVARAVCPPRGVPQTGLFARGGLWGPGAGRVGPGETGARACVSSALAHASRTAPHRQAPRCGSRASDQSDRGDTGGTVAVQGAQRSEAGGACGFWPRAGRGCQASPVSGARPVALAAAALASPRPTREGGPCPAPCRSRAQGPALVPRRGLSSGVGRVVPGQ